jgi:DNA-nicking Smr family endonuclease
VGKNGRPVSPDELCLWRKAVGDSQSGEGQTCDGPVVSQPGLLPQTPATNATKRAPSGPNPGGLGRHEARAIKRRRLPIDGRIDLHGMTQDVARRELAEFIRDSAGRGYKCVLVVTGKGGSNASRHNKGSLRHEPEDAQFMGKRPGVLKNAVPGWLSGSELGSFVIGFQSALPRDGGSGALYVLLRRG